MDLMRKALLEHDLYSESVHVHSRLP
jgi:hypothetical protein